MERIIEPNSSFPFDQLVLSTPTFVNSGNYFIKYAFNDSPLYIQPPKCVTKQGIIKGGKKMFCDLLFTNEHESLIQWMENLETYSQNYIFQHRAQWFESELEMHDIENSFTSSIRVFKSGKFYIIRTMIPTRLGKCTLKIFNEDEEEVPYENIKDMTQVVTIWEILGIKCSSRSFQIDIEVKQMMVINPSTLFEKCVISTKQTIENSPKHSTLPPPVLQEKSLEPNSPNLSEGQTSSTNNFITDNDSALQEDVLEVFENDTEIHKVNESEATEPSLDEPSMDETIILEEDDQEENNDDDDQEEEDDDESPYEILDAEEGLENIPTSSELEMVDWNLQDIQEDIGFQLKNRNDVYHEIYEDAKKKAEEARNLAISAHLEAKRIKELYMLQ